MVRALAVFAAVAGAGCSYRTDAAMYEGQPLPAFQVVSSSPADQSTNVPTDTSITIVFSDAPDPASVAAFGAISLRSGANSFDFTATVVGQSIVVKPRAALTPQTQYEVSLATAKSSAGGLKSIHGVGLVGAAPSDTRQLIRFSTASLDGGAPRG